MRAFPSIRMHVKMANCRWDSHDEDMASLIDAVKAKETAMPPFPLFGLIDEATLQLECARTWVRHQRTEHAELGPIDRSSRHERIRVGYFSWDFREHAVATAIAQLFEVHSREEFEWVAFSLGPDTQDAMRKRLEGCFDRFIDVRGRSDLEVAQLSRSLEIDVAVDLSGHTMGSRPGIFALRAAPVQVSYLGYSGTMGAPYIDYMIGDETVIPAGSERYYEEKIIYMPHSYLVSDATRTIAERRFTREELGLPERGFVYCCFNNAYKITPQVFEIWMRILARVEGSVLWLSGSNETAQGNLRREAERRGVAGQRLIFSKRLELMSEHLARHRAADLFLDTLPYNAHTTASDALWTGLPVLTRLGESFASRVAGSLLTVLELSELITHTAEEYEELAVGLAHDAGRLERIRAALAQRLPGSALYDTPRYARHLESAYRSIHERYHAAQSPEYLHITP
jgi:predicted O-linked N-acetylglucosamine transferase (SPINDLY family)